MKKSNHKYLQCPRCSSTHLNYFKTQIVCPDCGNKYMINKGMPEMLLNLSNKVRKEITSWKKFADSEGWLKPPAGYLNLLPSPAALKLVPTDTINWKYHQSSFENILKDINLKGKLVLDLAAGRCWTTKLMALKGAKCFAIDILDHDTIGLGAGKLLMKKNNIYFERIVADMNNLPFKPNIFDIVMVSGSLHHTVDFEKTISEISRVLKNDGLLLITNEPCSKNGAVETIPMTGAQEGINEHSYRFNRIINTLSDFRLRTKGIFPGPAFYDPASAYYGGKIWINLTRLSRKFYNIFLRINGGTLSLIAEKISTTGPLK